MSSPIEKMRVRRKIKSMLDEAVKEKSRMHTREQPLINRRYARSFVRGNQRSVGARVFGSPGGGVDTNNWWLVEDWIAPAAWQQHTFPAVNLDTVGGFMMLANVTNASAGVVNLSLLINNDLVNVNYYRVWLEKTWGGLLNHGNTNGHRITAVNSLEGCFIQTYLARNQETGAGADGYPRWNNFVQKRRTVTFQYNNSVLHYYSAVNVVRLDFYSNVANSLSAGDRLQLYAGI